MLHDVRCGALKIVLKIYARASDLGPHSRLSTDCDQAIRQRGQKGLPEAIAGLDLAIESLYAHTDSHKIGTSLSPKFEGTLRPEQEEKLPSTWHEVMTSSNDPIDLLYVYLVSPLVSFQYHQYD